MSDIAYAQLTYGSTTVTLGGHSISKDGLFITGDGIEGWHSSPATKASQTERESGNGAHDVPQVDVLYAARTVTVHVGIGDHTTSRGAQLAAWAKLQAAIGQLVKFRVVDDTSDTYVDNAYIDLADFNAGRPNGATTATMTVYCPRPERLSTQGNTAIMIPSTNSGGGLTFVDGVESLDDTKVLSYPLNFGDGAIRSNNVCTITNRGTYTAAPMIIASGHFPNGIVINIAGEDKQLKYPDSIYWVPLTLDCRSRTAFVNGIDRTRTLTSRDFPTIPTGSSITLSLYAQGTGKVTVISHDTYI